MAHDPNKPTMPPIPRDHDAASFSEMVPFRSTKIKLFKSPLFLLAVLAAVATPFLFTLLDPALGAQDVRARMGLVMIINIVAVFFIVMLFQLLVFLYVRTDRSLWHYMVAFVGAAALIHFPVLSMPYMVLFRQILPGQYDPSAQYTFIQQFVIMFFAAGMLEELLKATPILIGAGLTLWSANRASEPSGLVKFLQVRGPLDGAVMGIFAGGGFIFVETAFQYVPNIMGELFQKTQDPGLASAAGMLLLLPRVFGGLVGHMAYSGLFGYFIGLSVIRPQQKWKLLGIGYFSAATIHALWNSVPLISPLLYYAVALVCAIALASVILKAREIEMRQRSADGSHETFGSIVVDRRPVAPVPQAAPIVPAYVAPPPAAQPKALALEIEGLRIPLRAGAMLDLGDEPALGGRGAGVLGAVVAHPNRAEVLGLRNAGASAWTARLRDGSQQRIERDQNIRLAAGVGIDFGEGLTGAVVGIG